jgi:hypothetical protein
VYLDSSVVYSVKPSLRKRFMKKLTRDRVVPIISARVTCVIFGIRVSLARPSEFRHQEENPGQAPFAGVEKLGRPGPAILAILQEPRSTYLSDFVVRPVNVETLKVPLLRSQDDRGPRELLNLSRERAPLL